MKICAKCKIEKQPTEFGNDKHRKDGKYPYCSECVRVGNIALRKRHNTKRTAYNKEYRESNRERYNEWEREYFLKNSDKLNAKGKAWRDGPKGTYVVMHLAAKDRARRRGMEYELSPQIIEELCSSQNNLCALTGVPFDYAKTNIFKNRPYAPSIDRRDSTKGYTLDNVQITLGMVNTAKNEYHQEMFDDMCIARVRWLDGAKT